MRRFAPFAATLLVATVTVGGLATQPLPASADTPTGLDPSYGVDGVALFGAPDERLISITDDTDPSGRVVISSVGDDPDGIFRLTSSGALDESFGDEGVVPYPGTMQPLRVRATGNAIYLAGTVSQDANTRVPAVARLTDSGALDLTWGGDGIVELPNASTSVRPLAFDVGPAGEVAITVSGLGEGAAGYRLYRILANGTIDDTFDHDGVFEVPSPAGLGPDGVQIDAAGRIVVAEATETNPITHDDYVHRVRRLLPTGAADPQFGSAGVTELGAGVALAAAISPIDGSIVLGGQSPSGDGPTVWKLRANGTLDLAFGDDGIATTFGAFDDGLIEDLVLLPSGRIAVRSQGAGGPAFLIRPDGTLETTFGTDGGVAAPHWTPWDGLGVGANGQLLVVSSDLDTLHTEVDAYLTSELPTVAPTITSVTAGKASLSVKWDASEVEVGGPVRSYYVYATDHGALAGAAIVAGDVRQVSLTGLTNGHALDVVVLPFTDKGALTASDAVTGTPSASAPAATLSTVVRNVTATPGKGFATVTWQPPVDDGGSPIALYVAVAVRLDTNTPVAWRQVAADVRSASLPLANGVAHSIIVMPFSSTKGFGAIAPAVTVTPTAAGTASAAPTLPYAAATASGSSAYVAWGPAAEHGQAVAGYQVLVVRNGVLTTWVSRGVDDRSATVPIATTGTIDVYVIANSATALGAPAGPIHVRP